jgi:hypothetical protein
MFIKSNYKESTGSSRKGVGRKEKRDISLSPRGREANNNNCTTLVQGITKIGTEQAMKNYNKALHELTTHITKKSTEGNICRPPDKLMRA